MKDGEKRNRWDKAAVVLAVVIPLPYFAMFLPVWPEYIRLADFLKSSLLLFSFLIELACLIMGGIRVKLGFAKKENEFIRLFSYLLLLLAGQQTFFYGLLFLQMLTGLPIILPPQH